MILALDTTNFKTSVAICDQEKIIAFEQSDSFLGADGELMAFLSKIFQQGSLKPQHLTQVAVTLGPGSFTGTRVGIAAARAFALALKIPIFTLNSFEWVAQSYRQTLKILDQPLLVILESQRAEKFTALYNSSLEMIGSPSYLTPTLLTEFTGEIQNYKILGNGAQDFDNTAFYMPTALEVARCVYQKQAAGKSFEACRPFYLRPPEINVTVK